MLKDIVWSPCYRILSAEYPEVNFFDRIASPEELELIIELKQLTDPAYRDQIGEISLVPEEERITGPGTSPIMLAFTRPGRPSRFTDGTFGVFYAANTEKTAIEETKYHARCFLAATDEPEGTLKPYILLTATLNATLEDIRGLQEECSDIYDPGNYVASQVFGAQVKEKGLDGIVYDSVRHPVGECVAVLKPNKLSGCYNSKKFSYHWNGREIDAVQELGDE